MSDPYAELRQACVELRDHMVDFFEKDWPLLIVVYVAMSAVVLSLHFFLGWFQ